ncbi:MAG TPA: hypothetical protein VKP65_18590 [Rhodothermales bacterium]|nr:hypothetical protein [Rhodothermales bacterium]
MSLATLSSWLYNRYTSRLWGMVGMMLALGLGSALPARAQIDKLPHPDTTSGNFFGVAVSIDGDRALVGASSETTCGDNAGAAYLFERDSEADQWREAARLVPSVCQPGEFFGRSVSLSGDRVLVAASAESFAAKSSNAAYLFERDSTGTWRQAARLIADSDEEEGPFAASVSLDGDRALVTTWGDPSNGRFGGAAYIFEYDPEKDRWQRTARFTGSQGVEQGIFGGPAALDGDRAVVSASSYFQREPGSIYIFERDPATNTWNEAAYFGDIDDFFISVDVEGDRVLVGESKSGSRKSGTATLFTRDATGKWHSTATLRPPTPYDHGAFGSAVSLDGNRALVAGYDEQLRMDFNIDRVVYLFEYDAEEDAWEYRHIVDIGEVAFGASVDLDGAVALIGRASEAEPGAAYVVRLR